jgi:flagellar hook assembly protein FlgD
MVPMKKTVQRVEPIVKKALPAPVKPAEIPPSGTSERVSGNNLNVIVHRETAGPVVVRVVDAMGLEVRRLFSGTVQAGKWSFEWDGRAGDGSLVGPGKYRIEVQTEGTTQSREVNIK